MATTLKSIAQRDVSRLKTNAKNTKSVVRQSYNKSVSMVDESANKAKSTALQMYKASKNRLGNDVSQTTKNKLEVNYGGVRNSLSSAQSNAHRTLDNAKKQSLYGITKTYNTQKASSENNYGKKRLAEKVEKHTNKMKTYKDTISRFDTTKKCDAAIKKLKKSNDPDKKEKIAYIRAQRAALLQAEKAAKGGGGRGGRGWRRYGRGWRRYGGGWGNNSAEADVQVDAKNDDYYVLATPQTAMPTADKTREMLDAYSKMDNRKNFNGKKSSSKTVGTVNPTSVTGKSYTHKRTVKSGGSVARNRAMARRRGH